MKKMHACILCMVLAVPISVAAFQFLMHTRNAFQGASASCETVEHSMLTSSGDSAVGSTSSYLYRAGKMEGGTYSGPVCAVEFHIRRIGSPTGDITAFLYDNSGTSPNNQLLASTTTIDVSTLATGNTWVSFEFDGEVTSALWVVLRCDVNDLSNYVNWRNSGAFWSKGDYTSSNGTGWSLGNQRKMTYKLYSP